ncbi:MAG: hypothetical protein OK454_05840, partial [Thaumarchaeota archaeon]|nr:hypothetical protein [Nitrososphaerota archaeon]
MYRWNTGQSKTNEGTEWRIKYLNYKAGKEFVRASSRAVSRASSSAAYGSSDLPPRLATPNLFSFRWSGAGINAHQRDIPEDADQLSTSLPSVAAPSGVPAAKTLARSAPPNSERVSLARSPGTRAQYGSFVGSLPPRSATAAVVEGRDIFQLPGPATRAPSNTDDSAHQPPEPARPYMSHFKVRRSVSTASGVPGGDSSWGSPQPTSSGTGPRQRIRKMLSTASPTASKGLSRDISLQLLDDVRECERDFFRFLESELEKVETFYKQKEEQAGQRLAVLRDQLHEMRSRRTEEVLEVKRRKEQEHEYANGAKAIGLGISGYAQDGEHEHQAWTGPFKSKLFRPGPNSDALQKRPNSPVIGSGGNGNRDYVRRRHRDEDVPYRTAKRKLKLALQEFYRSLELLKSYALLNRTAFRKLNKKYDKAVNARPLYHFMNEKVNKAWFV